MARMAGSSTGMAMVLTRIPREVRSFSKSKSVPKEDRIKVSSCSSSIVMVVLRALGLLVGSTAKYWSCKMGTKLNFAPGTRLQMAASTFSVESHSSISSLPPTCSWNAVSGWRAVYSLINWGTMLREVLEKIPRRSSRFFCWRSSSSSLSRRSSSCTIFSNTGIRRLHSSVGEMPEGERSSSVTCSSRSSEFIMWVSPEEV